MGLDMYLYKRGGKVYNELTGEMTREDDILVGYWRKFNALHGYILDETNSDSDSNCEKIYLTKDNVENILNTLEVISGVLNDASYNEDEDSFDDDAVATVMDIMPPCHGFFFGGYEIDGYYKEQIDESIKVFLNALDLIDSGEDVYYYCWW